jgi:hypothetical protein
MSDLIDEITEADQKLEAAEQKAAEASRQLRRAKRELKDARQEVRLLIKELRSGQSRYPILERIELRTSKGTPGAPGSSTADEHQRGPTVFPQAAS